MELQEIEIVSNSKFNKNGFVFMESIEGNGHAIECFISMGGKLGKV